MKRLIISEQQAERLGRRRTGGERGEAFIVFTYRDRPSGLTVFGVEVIGTREVIAFE